MKKIKVGLFGASGRMGQEIINVLAQSKKLELYLILNRKTKGEPENDKHVDVWIDFSSPRALQEVLKVAVKSKKPLVCGTTGLSKKQQSQLVRASKKIPILWSSNMSLGVAVISEALKVFSILNGFDFQIEEIHHIHKKDRPSGTALTLNSKLETIVGKKLPQPIAIRGGGVFGVHKVFAISPEEMITIEHTALNRTVFAKGAVQAAEWLSSKKLGFYSMNDFLFGRQ